MVTIINLKQLYCTLQEEGTELGSLNAWSFVELGPSCVAKCMAGLNDRTDGRKAFSEQEHGDDYKLLRLKSCLDFRGEIAHPQKRECHTVYTYVLKCNSFRFRFSYSWSSSPSLAQPHPFPHFSHLVCVES